MAYNPPPNYGPGYAPPPQQEYAPNAYGQAPLQHDEKHRKPLANGDAGTFQGIQYSIQHRNTNATLNVELPPGVGIKSIAGAMVHMGAQVQMTGQIKLSFKKFLTGSNMDESTYIGPGPVCLAPTLMGDVSTLNIDPSGHWLVAKHSLLAWTDGVQRDTKSQSFSKTLFSGNDLFIYQFLGQGLIWIKSYGAIEAINLQPGQQHIVDNGHLVAWNCQYNIEKASASWTQAIKTGEGMVCRFTGPGTVYIQTRNLNDFSAWVRQQVPAN